MEERLQGHRVIVFGDDSGSDSDTDTDTDAYRWRKRMIYKLEG